MRSINIGASSMETIFRQIQFDRPIITTEFTEQQTSFTWMPVDTKDGTSTIPQATSFWPCHR